VRGKVGSLGAFWPFLEPVLDALAPRRVCEVGVEAGAFAAQLVAWCGARACAYVGVDPAPPDDVPDVVRGTSLDVLPRLPACDAYFIDGDHNYYTVRGELDAIARAAERHDRAPLVALHDVGWPWGRRDMYYAPERIPAEHRHAFSNELGVVLQGDDLVDGGLRDPGRYAIACRSGGPRNGVLTAVEDFLAGARHAGADWQMIFVPAAFGLAILYRAEALPEPCKHRLRQLETSVAELGDFLKLLESNYMSLFLFGEDAKQYAGTLQRHADGLQQQFTSLENTYAGLQRAYADLSAHSDSLLHEYNQLLQSYHSLENDRGRG
jgi:hypothetical protein